MTWKCSVIFIWLIGFDRRQWSIIYCVNKILVPTPPGTVWEIHCTLMYSFEEFFLNCKLYQTKILYLLVDCLNLLLYILNVLYLKWQILNEWYHINAKPSHFRGSSLVLIWIWNFHRWKPFFIFFFICIKSMAFTEGRIVYLC